MSNIKLKLAIDTAAVKSELLNLKKLAAAAFETTIFDIAAKKSDLTTSVIIKGSGIGKGDFEAFYMQDHALYMQDYAALQSRIVDTYSIKESWLNNALDPHCGYNDKITHGRGNPDLSLAIWAHKHYLMEGLPVFHVEHDPEFLAAFIWGPMGEWLGEIPSDTVREGIKNHNSFMPGNFPRNSFMPGNFPRNGLEGCFQITRFHPLPFMSGEFTTLCYRDYREMINAEAVGYLRRSPTTDEDRGYLSTMIAAYHQLRLWDSSKITDWIGAMDSGVFRFGYGANRDGEDRYDPLGVLAEINGLEWKWDSRENQYQAFSNDPAIQAKEVATLLGWKDTSPSKLHQFIKTLIQESDSASSFRDIVKILREGKEIALRRENDLYDIVKSLPPNIYVKNESFHRGVLDSYDSESSTIHTLRDPVVHMSEWQRFRENYKRVMK